MAYDCGKCNGTGDLKMYKHVAGGVCFTCGGTGKVSRKPAAPSARWSCFYAGALLLTKTAKTEAEAIKKAVIHWADNQTAPAFANVHGPQDIKVVRQ